MLVNLGELLAEELAAEQIPIGTQLHISDMTIQDPQGRETRVMRPGTLVGYGEFGHLPHALIEHNDKAGLPNNKPRFIPTNCLPKFAEIIEFDNTVEKLPKHAVGESIKPIQSGDHLLWTLGIRYNR